MRKEGEFNFVWLFALFVGGAILILAVYGAMKAGDTLQNEANTKTAKSLAILTDPMEAGFSDGSFSSIDFGEVTEIRNFCSDYEAGGFGRNSIAVRGEERMKSERNINSVKVSLNNKYIFSKEDMSSEEYYVFSKPFEMPFKVADMLFMMEENYCFIDAPEEIIEEIEGMAIKNIEAINCTKNDAVRVCFDSGGDCDVRVYGSCNSGCSSRFEEGFVEKDGENIEYVGNLIYAAIIADKDNYECNVKRLLYRTSKLSEVFIEKTDLMSARGCETNLKGDLLLWQSMTVNESSQGLSFLREKAKVLDRKNRMESCGVWN